MDRGSVGASMTGLHALVEGYAALGDHRTGTAVDRATRHWLRDELERRGAVVEEHAYHFDRYVSDASLIARGRSIPCEPVAYSGVGAIETDSPAVAVVETIGGVLPTGVDEAIAAARVDGAPAAVLVTRGTEGIVAMNREPGPADGIPAVLAPGTAHDDLIEGPVYLRLDARIEPGASANVVARFGSAVPDPYVLTTPLTGWYACAGERGTGIAVTLEAARRLASDHPVLVVATTGHELEFLGARVLLASLPQGLFERPRAVVHLGAGLAAGDLTADGEVEFSRMRFAMTTVDPGPLQEVLAPAGFLTGPGPDVWLGEGELWRGLGVPMLSMVAGFDTIHTPEDLPGRSTSPALLEVTADAVIAALRLLV